MKTITLNRAKYVVRDDRHTFLSDILKLTGKHKPVKPKLKDCPARFYPSHGATLSTAEYVKWFYSTNGLTLTGFYEKLSNELTVPEGEDSMEVCHED